MSVVGKPTVVSLEAHLDPILDTVPDAMIVIDERGYSYRSALLPN